MATTTLNQDFHVNGALSAKNFTAPAGSITNAAIEAATGIDASKMDHRHKIGTNFDLAIGGTVANREEVVFVASAACTINSFSAKLNTSATTGTTSFDCKKNGTTILSGTVDITSTETTTVQSGTLSVTSLVADDVLSIELSNSSGDGLGPFAWVEVDEEAL